MEVTARRDINHISSYNTRWWALKEPWVHNRGTWYYLFDQGRIPHENDIWVDQAGVYKVCTGEKDSGANKPVMKAGQDHFSQEICGSGGEWALDNQSEKMEDLAAAIVCASW